MQCIYLISSFCAVCVISLITDLLTAPMCCAVLDPAPATYSIHPSIRPSVIISFLLLCIPWDRCLQLGDLAFRICTHLSDTWRLASGGCVVQYGGCFWHTLIRTSSIDP